MAGVLQRFPSSATAPETTDAAPVAIESNEKKRARILLSGASLVVFVREATPIISDEGGFQQGASIPEQSDYEPVRVAASNCLLQQMVGTRFSGLTDTIR